MAFREESERHAIVIGGSMAGLLAARVLVDHFDRVTLIERDRLPDGPETRAGVPQARHPHVLLRRGQIILEELFPGIGSELVAAGALTLDTANDFAWLTPAGWGARFPSDLVGLACSRALLEWTVRRRLAGWDRVRFLDQTEVTGLLPDPGHTRIRGVTVWSKDPLTGSSLQDEPVPADLVVDAGGRRGSAPRWLADLAYDPPRETVVDAHLGYSTRVFRCPEDLQPGWKGLFLQMAPPDHTRGGMIFPVEKNQWLVTLVGGDGDYPPTDEVAFMEFARSLRSPDLYLAILQAEPLSPISGFRATENRVRHYERMRRRPDGFLVMGDSVCAFNPVYGQGMSAAAIGVLTLDRCLWDQRRLRPDGDLDGLAAWFQARLAAANKTPWMLATGEDYRFRGTAAAPPGLVTRLMHRYVDRVIALATKDSGVRRTLLEVFHLLKPPAALFRPGVLVPVLRESIARRAADQVIASQPRLPQSVETPGALHG